MVGHDEREVVSDGELTRKSGWLKLHKILMHKKRKIAMNSKREWKQYWATLTGVSLLLHHNEDADSVPLDLKVDVKIGLSLSLAHPVHDYIERDCIFSLGTANGSTYYIQTSSQLEVENWISAIHCAASMAMTIDNNREEAIENIQNKIRELKSRIKKEREEKISSLNVPTITIGATQYDNTTAEVEKCSVEIYRLESYLASLCWTEPPNSRALLGLVSSSTKLSLRKLGLFSVASLHSLVSTRHSSVSASFSSGSNISSSGFHFAQSTINFIRQRKDSSSSNKQESPEKACKPSLRAMEISGPFPMVQSPSTLLLLNRPQQSDTEDNSDSDNPSNALLRSTLDSATSLKSCLIYGSVSCLNLHSAQRNKFEQSVESLICPAPPSTHTELSRDLIIKLTVPTPPTYGSADNLHLLSQRSGHTSKEKETKDMTSLMSQLEGQIASPVAWTTKDRLRKCAQDLVDTEREYVLLLHALVEVYLSPLKATTLLSSPNMKALVGDIPDILQFQSQFLHEMEEALKLETKLSENESEENSHMMPVVSAIADAFLHHMDDFKRYSSFCSALYTINHILSLEVEGGIVDTTELRQFLDARNPQKVHSSTLPSLLTKPIVRISRYPVFLSSIMENIEGNETKHFQSAVVGMMKVANHINEMQRVSETYTGLFSIIMSEYSGMKSDINLSVPQLCFHDKLMWLNPVDDMKGSKQAWKKGKGPSMLCFVFSSAVVLVGLDKKANKKDSNKIQLLKVVTAVYKLTHEETTFRVLFPIEKCVVVNLPDSDGVTNMWQLCVQDKTKPTYFFRSQSPEKKEEIIQHIFLRQRMMNQRIQCQITSIPAS